MFPIQCVTFMELRLQQMGDFYEKPHFTMENFKFWEPVKWGWKFLHQTTKRHTLTPNLVEQIVWRMWQWRCFDTRERREKKVRENRHWKVDVVYNTTAATALSWSIESEIVCLYVLLAITQRLSFVFCLSVHPFIWPSVKRLLCDDTKQQTAETFIPHESTISLVF